MQWLLKIGLAFWEGLVLRKSDLTTALDTPKNTVPLFWEYNAGKDPPCDRL